MTPALAQVDGAYQNREEREIFSTGPGGDSGTILDAANPMDLINRIQRAGAMNDATPPSDAIDAALKELQQEPRTRLHSPDAGRPQSPSIGQIVDQGVRSIVSSAALSSLLEPPLHLGGITLFLVQHRKGDDGSTSSADSFASC